MKNKKAALRYTVVFLLAAFILSSCAGINAPIPTHSPGPTVPVIPSATEPPASAAPTAVPVSKSGGTLRLSMRAPKTLNPLLNTDITVARVLTLVFEPLTMLDDSLKAVSHLASLNFSSNGASVAVTLRGDVFWSDGTPVTAQDIIFSIETLRRAPEDAVYKHCIENFGECEILDEKSVKITFNEVDSASRYSFMFPIIPQHYYGNETLPGSERNMSPVGNGLFLFESYSANQSLTLTQSPYTFRERVNIEQVSVLITPDAETDFYAFNQGLTDIYAEELTEWMRRKEEAPLQNVKAVRYEEYSAMYYDFIGFNFSRELPAMLEFRETAARVLDLSELVNEIYLTHAVRALTPVHPDSWLYNGEVTEYNSNAERIAELSEKLLTTHSGETVEYETLAVLVNNENMERVKIARILTAELNKLGFSAETEELAFDEFSARILAGEFDLFVGSYNLSAAPDLRFMLHSDGNLLSYVDPKMDQLLEAVVLASSENLYRRSLDELQEYIARELPVISLAFRNSAVLADPRVQGELNPGADNIFYGINEWFIVEAAEK